ncbi:MAG: ATP:cob(I)alamin adenosyltransferase, partial [Rikenellaceae bacterium]|nr:ATP:cob(I)alamin adenosyltransferase [Rikenellaceae bacterium]
FTLPGGSPLVSQSHVARTVVRRAERRVVAVEGSGELFPEVLLLLNRLSDYLYVLGRRIAMVLGVEEILWIP